MGSRVAARRLLVGLLPPLALVGWMLLPSGQVSAAEPPQFKMGFATLAGMIPDVVGTPVVEEHHGANGDGLQETSTGLMVWRKADNWTAFTDGYRTWINGPYGLQVRTNDQKFDWETAQSAPAPSTGAPAPAPAPAPSTAAPAPAAVPAPAPTSAPAPAPAAAPTPVPQAAPTPQPKPSLRSSQPNVIQGQGLQANSVWILGEIHNDGTTPAYNVTVTGRLLSADGTVAGTNNQVFAYLGPGDTVGYQIEVQGVTSYARSDVSVDAGSYAGTAGFATLPITWVQNQQLKDPKAGARYEFTGILNNNGTRPVGLNAVYVWFLDDSDRVVWADYTYVTDALAPGGSYTFVIDTPWDSQNPQVDAITKVRYYAAGQPQ